LGLFRWSAATLFAAEQQAAYAPELNIVGAAAGGITGDLTVAPVTFGL
jgi:hypothetical protein